MAERRVGIGRQIETGSRTTAVINPLLPSPVNLETTGGNFWRRKVIISPHTISHPELEDGVLVTKELKVKEQERSVRGALSQGSALRRVAKEIGASTVEPTRRVLSAPLESVQPKGILGLRRRSTRQRIEMEYVDAQDVKVSLIDEAGKPTSTITEQKRNASPREELGTLAVTKMEFGPDGKVIFKQAPKPAKKESLVKV